MTVDQEQKKVWAGLKRPSTDLSAIKDDIDALQANSVSWEDFKTEVEDNATSYSDLETYLLNQGLSQEEADRLIGKIQNQYADFSAFQSDLSNYSSFQEWKSAFESTTTIGGSGDSESSTAGVKVHKTSGVSQNGVSVPADTLELMGVRIELSQAAPSSGEPNFDVTNFQTDDPDNVVNVFASITISVDVANTSAIPGEVNLTLTEDGSAIQSKTEYLFANSSTTVSFTVSKDEYVCADYAINGIGNETICWVPSGLII